ncbi:MAG TPA: polyphosphate kinase 2 [Spongiibacteraceae bacterium]|jgi:polyphosphate kinase 2
MAKQKNQAHDQNEALNGKNYDKTLRALQIELVKAQREIIREGQKILVIIEGRDAAGKDGTIKRVVEHMSPRETRVVALPKPSDRDRSSWYFQRYVQQLPAGGEFVIFNRSWYNRAGVERVMNFCSNEEYEEFMHDVLPFEHMLVNSGIKLIKYYLDIDKEVQRERLRERGDDPLKQWKISPIDELATKYWKKYSVARDAMFERTHNPITPWFIVCANDKNVARINVLKHLLSQLSYPKPDRKLVRPDSSIVFEYGPAHVAAGLIAK